MISDSSNGYLRWSKDEKEKLTKLHSEALPEAKSHAFFEKLTSNFKNRSIASVVEECRRLGLKAKRNAKADNCKFCPADLNDPESDRIGDVCRKCYNKNWYQNNTKNKNDDWNIEDI